jgi:uncharacterized membrane protein (DUF485 family)
MTSSHQSVQDELSRRYRKTAIVVAAFLVLDVVLVVIAFFASNSLYRPGASDPSIIMALWIAILVFGLGAFVLRRTKFAALRLKDIAAVKGVPALLKTLQDTTIQVAAIGEAVALMGFLIVILTGDWTNMLRAGGVAAIVLIYCYPFHGAWQRAVAQLAPTDSNSL